MLQASNLGQIVGRLMYGEYGEQAAATTVKKARTGVVGKIRAVLLEASHPMCVREVAAAVAKKFGAMNAITSFQAAMNINHMPDIEREGSRGSYRYKMRKAPPP